MRSHIANFTWLCCSARGCWVYTLLANGIVLRIFLGINNRWLWSCWKSWHLSIDWGKIDKVSRQGVSLNWWRRTDGLLWGLYNYWWDNLYQILVILLLLWVGPVRYSYLERTAVILLRGFYLYTFLRGKPRPQSHTSTFYPL